jgi:hypothetical protein
MVTGNIGPLVLDLKRRGPRGGRTRLRPNGLGRDRIPDASPTGPPTAIAHGFPGSGGYRSPSGGGFRLPKLRPCTGAWQS